MASGRSRATTFDEAPTLYDRFRPTYPATAIDALVEVGRVPEGGDVLEVGAGTGQLTRPLVERGFRVTALEPGERLARRLARHLHDGTARVLVQRFEDASIEPSTFDLVVSATAFHWVDETKRYQLAATALRPHGALGLLRNDHVAFDGSAAYYRGVRPIYERLAPAIAEKTDRYPPSADQIRGFADEVSRSGLFRVIDERRFAWVQRYTADEIVGLVRTYSDHRTLPARARTELLREIRAFVLDELGGSFEDKYLTTVCVGAPVRT